MAQMPGIVEADVAAAARAQVEQLTPVPGDVVVIRHPPLRPGEKEALREDLDTLTKSCAGPAGSARPGSASSCNRLYPEANPGNLIPAPSLR